MRHHARYAGKMAGQDSTSFAVYSAPDSLSFPLQPTIMTTQRPDNRATAISATTVPNWTLLAVAAALITLGMLVGSGRLGFRLGGS